MFYHRNVFYSLYRPIGLMGIVFANGSGDRDSIPGRVIPKTQKMLLDILLLNTRYKLRIKYVDTTTRVQILDEPDCI